jgi:hypothetical protein
LLWTAAVDDQGPLTYRVVRKIGSAPANSADGTVVDETAGTDWIDQTAIDGELYGYGVFSNRGGVVSVQCAATDTIRVLGEVSELRAEPSARHVTLRWRCPSGAFDVRVVRRRGLVPKGPDDGELIECQREEANDRNVDTDQLYYYAVFARYRMGDGALVAARGASVATIPSAHVIEPPELRMKALDLGRVQLAWNPPSTGEVRIARSRVPVPVEAGGRVSADQAAKWDVEWIRAQGMGTAEDSSRPSSGQPAHYTPVLFWSGHALVGAGIRHLSLPDPSELRVGRQGADGVIGLRWRWPPGVHVCLVAARMGREPSDPTDPQILRQIVTDRDYAESGGCEMRLPLPGTAAWQIRVFTVAKIDGTMFYSPGADPTARAVVEAGSSALVVSYRLRKPRLPWQTWAVEFKTDPPASVIPPTILVGHERTVPLSMDEGKVVASIPRARDGDQVAFRPGYRLNGDRLRLFLDPSIDPEGLAHVRFRHPGYESPRV